MSRGNICCIALPVVAPQPPLPPPLPTLTFQIVILSGIPLIRTKETEKSEK